MVQLLMEDKCRYIHKRLLDRVNLMAEEIIRDEQGLVAFIEVVGRNDWSV